MKLINEILFDKKQGMDCTEDESAYIKGWLRATTIRPEDGSQQVLEDIQLLFPLEYGEYLDEMEAAPSTPVEDKQTESNKQPLYKVLNEQRTKGEWRVREYDKSGEELLEINTTLYNYSGNEILQITMETEQCKSNVQYIQLAVNNFASLAEALEPVNEIDLDGINMLNENTEILVRFTAKQLIAAKEALQNIS